MAGVVPEEFHNVTLVGRHVRLEPLQPSHAEALLEAVRSGDPALYHWTLMPRDRAGMDAYVATACAQRDAGSAVPFATVRADGRVIGSTRLFDAEAWTWPAGSTRRSEAKFDVCEIGYTWLAQDAVRTAANTEAKLLMLGHAFETWNLLRVCFHTDARNDRSANALARIGATFEGVLRSHRIASDGIPRDSKRFSIVAADWPRVKAALQARLEG